VVDPKRGGVCEEEWKQATASCFELRVAKLIEETHEARSLLLEVPAELEERFRYRAGQFLDFKIPYQGQVLTRGYSLSSSPDCDDELRVTVKRVDDGRISNWFHDEVKQGDTLMVARPAGSFVLNDKTRPITFFAGGSGITPCISLIKTALVTTQRELRLIYASRDERAIVFRDELDVLARRYPERLEIRHSLDDRDGFLDVKRVEHYAVDALEGDFYLCGPGAFMDTLERALAALHVPSDQVHIERFVSPPDPGAQAVEPAAAALDEVTPETVTIVIDGGIHEVPYRKEERLLHAARRAGLEPPSSCEEGYCSCCMAKLIEGRVRMVKNDCLTPDLLAEGWVLTCQSVCLTRRIRVEYPD
jgi:3-ketosteroid 9alpha-monooxygenase subunit B